MLISIYWPIIPLQFISFPYTQFPRLHRRVTIRLFFSGCFWSNWNGTQHVDKRKIAHHRLNSTNRTYFMCISMYDQPTFCVVWLKLTFEDYLPVSRRLSRFHCVYTSLCLIRNQSNKKMIQWNVSCNTHKKKKYKGWWYSSPTRPRHRFKKKKKNENVLSILRILVRLYFCDCI